MNELEIIEENDKSPSGVSNYLFANNFNHTDNFIYMIDLRTGFIVKDWNFNALQEYQE